MCACSQRKDSELADKLRSLTRERDHLIKELNDRGYKLTAHKADGSLIGVLIPAHEIRINKVETITL